MAKGGIEPPTQGFSKLKTPLLLYEVPFCSNTEGSTRERSPGETDSERQLLDRGYIVFERYEKKKEIFVRFSTLKYKFMAVFGPKTEKIFADTNQLINSIFTSANMLATYYWKRQGRVQMEADEFQRHLDEMRLHEGIFWDGYNKNDKIREKLAEIQISLETVTKPCFEEPMKAYTIFTKSWFSKG